jgi:predicted acyl esterase
MVSYNDPLTDPATWKKRSPYLIKAGSPEAKKYPGFKPRSVLETPEGLQIDYDVAVTLRDGVKMYVDIYRPANQSASVKIPVVIAWTPVGLLILR